MLGYHVYIAIISLLVTSCGGDDSSCDSESLGQPSSCNSTLSAASTTTSTTATEDFVIRGSVNSAFAVTVDGKSYSDIEEYYTAESAALPGKVEAAGYEDYTVRFDASIGFNDLTQGMTVYIAGKEKRGYQNKTVVARNDTFAAKLPGDAAGDIYQIRANKRFAVVMTKGTEIKKICFNFSATDLEVAYDKVDSPVILSDFKTSLTSYECAPDSSTAGVQIPSNSDNPTEYIVLSPANEKTTIHNFLRNSISYGKKISEVTGVSPDTYNDVWSSKAASPIRQFYDYLRNQISFGVWVWFSYDTWAKPNGRSATGWCEAERPYLGNGLPDWTNLSKDCGFLVDGQNRIIFQRGIRIEYLDPLSSWPTLEEAMKSTGCDLIKQNYGTATYKDDDGNNWFYGCKNDLNYGITWGK